MTEKQYPELPTHFMLVQESFRDEVYLYTADQMRAYVDADRAMRAARDTEDAAHIKNLCELVQIPNSEYVADAHNAAGVAAERKRCATMHEAIEAAVKAFDMGFMPNEILDENSPIMQAFRYAIRAGDGEASND